MKNTLQYTCRVSGNAYYSRVSSETNEEEFSFSPEFNETFSYDDLPNHPNDDASEFEQRQFKAVEVARDHLGDGINEAAFARAVENRDKLREILNEYYAELAEC